MSAGGDLVVSYVHPSTLKGAPYNPRVMPDEQMAALMKGIERFGFVDPVIVNEVTGHIVGGHQRVEAARRLKLKRVPVVHVSLDETGEKALNVALNKVSGEFDLTLLAGLLGELKLEGFDLDLTGFGDLELADLLDGDGAAGLDVNYSRRIVSPVYVPTEQFPPPVTDLFDESRTAKLRERIRAADIPEQVAGFLLKAAERHTAFNFRAIAEFYAHADAPVQRLMEESALIIIDFGQAVDQGFVELTKNFQKQFKEEQKDA